MCIGQHCIQIESSSGHTIIIQGSKVRKKRHFTVGSSGDWVRTVTVDANAYLSPQPYGTMHNQDHITSPYSVS